MILIPLIILFSKKYGKMNRIFLTWSNPTIEIYFLNRCIPHDFFLSEVFTYDDFNDEFPDLLGTKEVERPLEEEHRQEALRTSQHCQMKTTVSDVTFFDMLSIASFIYTYVELNDRKTFSPASQFLWFASSAGIYCREVLWISPFLSSSHIPKAPFQCIHLFIPFVQHKAIDSYHLAFILVIFPLSTVHSSCLRTGER